MSVGALPPQKSGPGANSRSSLPTVALGLEDEQQHGNKENKTHIEVYREHFQKPFLTATENYYKAESEGFLAENNISDYLRLAEKRLEEEENRVNLYMHSQTKQPVSRWQGVLNVKEDRMD